MLKKVVSLKLMNLVDGRQLAILVNLQLLEKQRLEYFQLKRLIRFGLRVLNHMLHGC